MEQLFSKDIILWDSFYNILDYKPDKMIVSLEKSDIIGNFYKQCDKLLEYYDMFAVSISGGVDSMLLSYFVAIYAKKNKKTLQLLHINYNNRDCCSHEVAFLEVL